MEKADLEDETVDEVLRILRAEFEEEPEEEPKTEEPEVPEEAQE